MTVEYATSLAEVRNATAKFKAIRTEFYAGKVDDSTFLAAKAEYNKAEAIFDKSYAQEVA